jgi:hypothetical protein
MKINLTNSKTELTETDYKSRETTIYWNLSNGVRQGTMSKDVVEKRISFIIANSKSNSFSLEKKLLELRELNRKRKNV